jgi:hypothetical protein
MQENMQEKTTMNSVASTYKGMLLTLAWLLLFVSWFFLALASRDFVKAAQDYGVLDARTFLDAGFGYFGLFSFGMTSVAVMFAVKGGLKSDQKLFRFFKTTFLVNIIFLTPTLFSMVVFLLSQV